MATNDTPPAPKLKAARPALREGAEYMPRIPWRWVLFGTLSVTTVIAGYTISQSRKAEALRGQIVRVHEQLSEPSERYFAVRSKLEDWILAAASKAPDSYADKRLRIPGLRSGKGLYLRLMAKDAADKAGIARGARAMEADLIPSCLGLAPASARGIWEKGEFLEPAWIDDVRKNDSVMKLRVTDDMLARHLRTDLPALLNMIRSDWFLLVLQQGPTRHGHPVDVFLWDMRSGEQLLRGRVESRGVLLGARIRSKDGPIGMTPRELGGATADDCALAAQLKQLAGTPAPTVENVPAPQAPAAPGAPAAAQAKPASSGIAPALRGGASVDEEETPEIAPEADKAAAKPAAAK